MAVQSQDVTNTPTALSGTTADQTYTVQNLGVGAVEIAVGSSTPEATTTSRFRIEPGEFVYPTPSTGESVYVWKLNPTLATVAYEEAD